MQIASGEVGINPRWSSPRVCGFNEYFILFRTKSFVTFLVTRDICLAGKKKSLSDLAVTFI